MAIIDKINVLGDERDLAADAMNVSYSGSVSDADNVKDALDSLQTQINGGITASGTEKRILRVMSYNVGGFCMGRSPQDGYISDQNSDLTLVDTNWGTGAFANYAMQLSRWKKTLASVNADLMCWVEYHATFGSLNGSLVGTGDSVLDDYPYIQNAYVGGWWNQAIIAQAKLATKDLVDLTGNYTYNGVAPNTKSKAVHSSFVLGEKTVHVFSVHLNHNGTEAGYHSRIEAEIPALVALYDSYDYIIIAGDFNTCGEYKVSPTIDDYADGINEFQPFITKGFKCVNNPSNVIFTYPSLGLQPNTNNGNPYQCIDNIIVKGFDFVGSRLVNNGMLTDHCGLVADLVLTD